MHMRKTWYYSAKLAVLGLLNKLLHTDLSTPLQPLHGSPPHPRMQQYGKGAAVQAHERRSGHHGGAGAYAPVFSIPYRVRYYGTVFYALRETIYNIYFFLVCDKVKIKVHSYGIAVCNCKSVN